MARLPAWIFDDATERDATGTAQGVIAGDFCFQRDTLAFYSFNGATWAAVDAEQAFSPIPPPASPNVLDLEFNDVANLTPFTAWDPGTVGINNALDTYGRMQVLFPASNPAENAGYYMGCPSTASNWSAWTRISMTGRLPSTYASCGFGLFDAGIATPSTADLWKFAHSWRGGTTASEFAVQRWASYNTFTADDVLRRGGENLTTFYLRIRWSTTGPTISFDYSLDGLGWVQLYSTSSLFLIPTQIAIVGHVEDAGYLTLDARVDFIRFTASAAYDQVMEGA